MYLLLTHPRKIAWRAQLATYMFILPPQSDSRIIVIPHALMAWHWKGMWLLLLCCKALTVFGLFRPGNPL